MSADIARLIEIVGGDNIITPNDPQIDQYLWDSRHYYHGQTMAVIFPRSVQQIQHIIIHCTAQNIAIIPMGGNTGRCAGATPLNIAKNIIINMRHLNKIIAIQPHNNSVLVESGVILAQLHQYVAEYGKFFPLNLGSAGSCTIGGNIATNAGGHNTLKYGNMRDAVLGLEVILPNGQIMNDCNYLRKNNTGYDVKQLFIGGEGTLGIITKAVLKLAQMPINLQTLLLCADNLDKILPVYEFIQAHYPGQSLALELIPRIALDLVAKHYGADKLPFNQLPEWVILWELDHNGDSSDGLGEMAESGLISDGLLAQNAKQRDNFWQIRSLIVEAQAREGASIKHDIALPIDKIPQFINQANALLHQIHPHIRPYCFGHLGDGNLHFNLSAPLGMDNTSFMAMEEEIHQKMHDITHEYGGSFSAEHGVGRIKIKEMQKYKDPVTYQLMKNIKNTLDPQNIFNPAVIF